MLKSKNVTQLEILVDAAEGLILRRPRASDMRFMRSLATREDIMRTQGGVLNGEQLTSFLQFVKAHWKEHGFGHYILWKGRRIICLFSLKLLRINASMRYDLGFAILPRYRNQGIATRAAKALLDVAFGKLGLKKVTAVTVNENGAGERVLEKLHFSKAGKTDLIYMGKDFDCVTRWELTARIHFRKGQTLDVQALDCEPRKKGFRKRLR
jgi:RimJ/RimL family protein N-acetyltransferase